MTLEMLIIAAVRVAGSLPVLRWPLLGGIVALLVDQSDLFMMNLIDLGGVTHYQPFDKYLDQVYMLTFLAVAFRWEGVPRTIAVGLYGYRMVGFLAFEMTGSRDILLFFPNVFEFWFLFVASLPHWLPNFAFARGPTLAWGALLLALKEFQEYALHWGQWLDTFTFDEAIDAIWDALTFPFG